MNFKLKSIALCGLLLISSLSLANLKDQLVGKKMTATLHENFGIVGATLKWTFAQSPFLNDDDLVANCSFNSSEIRIKSNITASFTNNDHPFYIKFSQHDHHSKVFWNFFTLTGKQPLTIEQLKEGVDFPFINKPGVENKDLFATDHTLHPQGLHPFIRLKLED